MIAKAEWFNRRKYTGWGLTPKTWQGVVYVLVFAGLIVFIQSLSIDETFKLVLSGIWIIFLLIDVLHIMATLNLDEREQKIEAIAERNASWTMVASVAFSLMYVLTIGRDLKGVELIPVLLFPLFAGGIAKGISNYILDKKGV